MIEVRMRGARRHDQIVVRDLAVDELHDLVTDVDAGRLSEEYVCIRLSGHDRPNRIRDVARIQRRGGYLIEQRLKEVIVAPIDDRDPRRRALEGLCRVQPAEATAEDDDAR